MKVWWKAFTVGVSALALLTGCSDGLDDSRACTLIGASHGITLAADPDVAGAEDLVVTVCADDACTDHDVRLTFPDQTISKRCEQSGPRANCRLKQRGDGSGFASIGLELPEGPVQVSARYERDGRTVETAATTVELTTSYPNGPDCGADGTHAGVRLSSAGLSGTSS